MSSQLIARNSESAKCSGLVALLSHAQRRMLLKCHASAVGFENGVFEIRLREYVDDVVEDFLHRTPARFKQLAFFLGCIGHEYSRTASEIATLPTEALRPLLREAD